MSTSKTSPQKVLNILKLSVDTIANNKIILLPFLITAFLQLLILEILYFSNRFPLNTFFGPIISRVWSEKYLHYPFNFILIPKMYQYTQMPLYIFVSSYLIAVGIAIVAAINGGETLKLKQIFIETLKSYIHVFIYAVLTFFIVMGFFQLYEPILARALKIRSQSGLFFIIKSMFIHGAPYINLVSTAIVTTLFAYALPFIIIEKKKIFSALLLGFKNLKGCIIYTFLIILLPTLLYVPVLILRNNSGLDNTWPELRGFILILSILVMCFIDAISYTAITISFLIKKDK